MSSTTTLELRYSPNGRCAEKVVEIIDETRSMIRAMVYNATLEEISAALVRARNRAVDIRMVLDKRSTFRDQAKFKDKLTAAGIEVRLYGSGFLMHHKVGIFDGRVVTTGSFNWTKGGQEKNNENLVTISNNAEIAGAYTQIFDEIWERASPEGRFARIRRFGRFLLTFLPISGRYYPAHQ